jgi:NAD(P)-dependent dehydrogenase (short-subunit alcohol dehydrogenase family)
MRDQSPAVGPAVSTLDGRVVLLTGASGGIGKGIGRALADEGVDLFLTYGRHSDDAEEVAAYARGVGRRVVVASADLADPAAPARLVEQAKSELGGVDILVANAGTATVKGWEKIDRVGRPEEVADMAIAMLRNGYLTNKVVTLDGGILPR